jgi:hypothetical protein
VFKVADVVNVASGFYEFKFNRNEPIGMILPILAPFPSCGPCSKPYSVPPTTDKLLGVAALTSLGMCHYPTWGVRLVKMGVCLYQQLYTIEFTLTIASFLVTEGHIDPALEELKMAALCIDYLNLPAFLKPVDDNIIRNGDFGFMDYAVLNWIRHVEVGASHAHDEEALMSQLSESLEIFLDEHWDSPSARFQVSQGTEERLKFFINSPNYDKLEQTIASTRKQLTYFGQMRKGEMALDLPDVVDKVREVLEKVVGDTSLTDPDLYNKLTQIYGTSLFKCFRFSCRFFTNGFDTADDRDKHVGKHLRPFRCNDEHCLLGYMFGFAQEREFLKHMREMHPPSSSQEEEFPTDQEVAQSIAAEPVAVTHPVEEEIQETTEVQEVEIVMQDPEPEPVHIRVLQRKRQTEFKCEHCGKVFSKRYNLDSHKVRHGTVREHKCEACGMDFARLNDLRRHSKKHTGEAVVYCGGILSDGREWGCGKAFARADVLTAHHRSETGRACILPVQQSGQDIPELGDA